MKHSALVNLYGDYFPDDFARWVDDNEVIVDRFISETDKVVAAGFEHYGAHPIVQYIRHETALRQRNSEFKISNNVFPYLARLFALLHPSKDYIFSYKQTNTRKQFVPISQEAFLL